MTDTDTTADAGFMRRALELAERGWGQVAPNPLVGAVVVSDGEIVGEGWHSRWGAPHAEVEALRDAGDAARGATMYVTLEPCNHHGKTPPCTQAILDAGIAEVVLAASDPNPAAAGGAAMLEAAGVTVRRGVEKQAAERQNAIFLRANSASPLPWVELKLALSLDGRIADAEGASTWITGDEARAEVHRLRAAHDSIAVGIGTALADDPILTVRGEVASRVPPRRVIFDRQLRLSPSSRLLRSIDQAPVIVLTSRSAPADRSEALRDAGATVIAASTLEEGLIALRDAEVTSIFVEGGAALASSLLAADLVDRLSLFIAPVLIGPGGMDPFAGLPDAPLASAHRWHRVRTATFGEDTLITVDR